MKTTLTQKRAYTMRQRAEGTAATRRRIMDAVVELLASNHLDRITLTAIADQAGVSVPTVIQHFGSKESAISEAVGDAGRRIREQRDAAPVGDVQGAVANLIEHYETWGEQVMRLLSLEDQRADVKAITEPGRAYHRAWVEKTFAPQLSGLRGAARQGRTAQLVAVTDVYFWNLLRRQQGLSRARTIACIVEIVTALKGEDR